MPSVKKDDESHLITRLLVRAPFEILLALGAVLAFGSMLCLQIFVFESSEIRPEVFLRLSVGFVGSLMIVAALCVFSAIQDRLSSMPQMFQFFRNSLVFSCYLGLFLFLDSLLTAVVFSLTDLTWMGQVSLWYLQLDTWLGVYDWMGSVIAFIVGQPLLYAAIDTSYRLTLPAVFVGVGVLVFSSWSLTRQFLIAFFVAQVLCSVVWAALPALAPYQLAITDSFANTEYDAVVTEATSPVLDLHTQFAGTQWAETTDAYASEWEAVTADYGYAISSNPSMHVLWGMLLLVFLWRVHWLFGCAAAIFFIFETIGTMFFLQHYLIDLPMGVLFAFIALYITKKLTPFEERHFADANTFWFGLLSHTTQLRGAASRLLKR